MNTIRHDFISLLPGFVISIVLTLFSTGVSNYYVSMFRDSEIVKMVDKSFMLHQHCQHRLKPLIGFFL